MKKLRAVQLTAVAASVMSPMSSTPAYVVRAEGGSNKQRKGRAALCPLLLLTRATARESRATSRDPPVQNVNKPFRLALDSMKSYVVLFAERFQIVILHLQNELFG